MLMIALQPNQNKNQILALKLQYQELSKQWMVYSLLEDV